MKNVRAFCGLILEFLRELAGENAYNRHLKSHGLLHSAEEWRKFADQHFRAKYARPKCC